MSEREHAAEPVNAASIRAVGAVDPVAPRNITNKKQSYIWTGWVQASLHLGRFIPRGSAPAGVKLTRNKATYGLAGCKLLYIWDVSFPAGRRQPVSN